MTVLSCKLPAIFAQIRVAPTAAGRSQRATLPINNGWILKRMCKRACFAISSCSSRREKRAFEMWLLAEVLDWVWLLEENGAGVRAGEVDCPNTCLKVLDPSAQSRL